ncbi:hypothetical protein [Mesorhizobium sp. P5_C1]
MNEALEIRLRLLELFPPCARPSAISDALIEAALRRSWTKLALPSTLGDTEFAGILPAIPGFAGSVLG